MFEVALFILENSFVLFVFLFVFLPVEVFSLQENNVITPAKNKYLNFILINNLVTNKFQIYHFFS